MGKGSSLETFRKITHLKRSRCQEKRDPLIPVPLLSASPFSPLSSCQVTWASIASFQLPPVSAELSFPLGPRKRHHAGRTGFSIYCHNSVSFPEDHVFFFFSSLRLPILSPPFNRSPASSQPRGCFVFFHHPWGFVSPLNQT